MISSDYRLRDGYARPPRLARLTSTFPFVGRSAELERLRALMPRADGEGGASCCWAASRARARAGSCASSPPRPARRRARALRRLRRGRAHALRPVRRGARPAGPRRSTPDELRAALGARAASSRACCPIWRARRRARAAGQADPDTERHRLHTAVATLLAGVSRGRPVLLVLEDGHWADAPTLLLLRHLARAGERARLLLLATFRDAEADIPEALAETLADLRRSDVVRMRPRRLLRRRGRRVRPPCRGRRVGAAARWRTAIADLTGGNAFLVCELWRELVETGMVELAGGTVRLNRSPWRARQPESVREVVSQRLARLRRDHRPARAGGHRRRRSSSSTSSGAPPGSATPSCSARSTRPCAAG